MLEGEEGEKEEGEGDEAAAPLVLLTKSFGSYCPLRDSVSSWPPGGGGGCRTMGPSLPLNHHHLAAFLFLAVVQMMVVTCQEAVAIGKQKSN